MTLNGVIAFILRFLPNSIALLASYVTVVEDRPIISAEYYMPVPFFHCWPKLTYPAARLLCDSWATCSPCQGRNHGWKVEGDQDLGPNTGALAPRARPKAELDVGCGRESPPPDVRVRVYHPRKICENSDAKSCILAVLAVKFLAFRKPRPRSWGTNRLLVPQPRSWGTSLPRSLRLLRLCCMLTNRNHNRLCTCSVYMRWSIAGKICLTHVLSSRSSRERSSSSSMSESTLSDSRSRRKFALSQWHRSPYWLSLHTTTQNLFIQNQRQNDSTATYIVAGRQTYTNIHHTETYKKEKQTNK